MKTHQIFMKLSDLPDVSQNNNDQISSSNSLFALIPPKQETP